MAPGCWMGISDPAPWEEGGDNGPTGPPKGRRTLLRDGACQEWDRWLGKAFHECEWGSTTQGRQAASENPLAGWEG